MEHSWQYGVGRPPSPQAVQARTYLLDLMQRGLPGYPTDDRYLQSQKFTGLIYNAVKPLMRAVRSADVVCLRRVRKRNNRTTFGPGVVAKSVTGAGRSQRDDYAPVDADHPVARVLDRPQGSDGAETLGDVLEYATLQACLTGVSPFWCVPSAKYLSRDDWRPVQLYALPTALTVPQPTRGPEYPHGFYRLMPYYASPTGGAGWYQGLAGSAAGAILDGREVKRRLHPHPLYRWDGYSPLTACAFLLDIAEAIDQSRWAAMNHGVSPDLMVTISGADQHWVESFKEQATQKHGGSRNHRKMMVLGTPTDQGKVDVKTPFIAAREMDYVNSWEQASAAVFAVFGVPKALVYGGSNYAETYAAERYYHNHTVTPECEEIGDILTTAVAQPWEAEPGELFIEVRPREPKNEELAVISAKDLAEMGLVTVNQTLVSQNLPPVPDGDVPLSVFTKLQEKKAGVDAPPPGLAPPPPPGKGKPAPGDTPTGGAPPRPDNPEGEGTRPPTGAVAKAMSTLDASAGGALIPPASVGAAAKVVTDPRAVRRLMRRRRKRQ